MEGEDSLEKYSPNVKISSAFDIDEHMSDADLTYDAFKKLILARKTQDMVFLFIGRTLKIFRDRKLYKHLDYDNFTQFLASEELSFSRETAYSYIQTYELYVEKLGLDINEIGKLGIVRLKMMAPVIKEMDKEEAIQTIEDHKDMRYSDFVHEIKTRSNRDGKPNLYFSETEDKWVVAYYENTTKLSSLGVYEYGE